MQVEFSKCKIDKKFTYVAFMSSDSNNYVPAITRCKKKKKINETEQMINFFSRYSVFEKVDFEIVWSVRILRSVNTFSRRPYLKTFYSLYFIYFLFYGELHNTL